MLAVLFFLGLLCPQTLAELSIQLVDPTASGLLTNKFPNAFLLSLPNCTVFANKSVNLLYTEVETTLNKTATFTVPGCGGSIPGYLLENLKSGTKYNMSYTIDTEKSAILSDSTTTVSDYQQINSGLEARSGAMVVITVILSLAMVILLAAIILLLFFSG